MTREPEPLHEPKPMSRRRFGAMVLGTGAAVAAGAVTIWRLADSPEGGGTAIRTFRISHDPAVYVTMTNGEEFVVEVKERGTGRVLEHHDGVTAYNLLDLPTDHVSIVGVD